MALVDDLVDPGVLKYLKRSARIVHVGKRGGCHAAPTPWRAMAAPQGGWPALGRPGGRPSTPQAFIHKLMIQEAQRGERVVRIKGGDPFVFGRGGEECAALRDAGIEVEVISGLTAGIAGPATLGIPVTDRRFAPGVALVTGHAKEGGVGPDWQALARSGLTLVVYMGVARLAHIAQRLMDGGLGGDTPVALISTAHTPAQRQLFATLATVAAQSLVQGMASPAVLVVGDVVQAAPAWHEVASAGTLSIAA